MLRFVLLLVAALCVAWQPCRADVELLAFGDWGWPDSHEQQEVARTMASYARTRHVRFDAALLLGDNFYGRVDESRWRTDFEEVYDVEALAMPFYAALGNHDYSARNVESELDRASRHPHSRWRMPARWYRVELPPEAPLVSVLVLDSNVEPLGDAWHEEQAWLERELARPRPGKWLVAIAHHPLFSNGEHGDSKRLIESWGPLFRQHKLDFYLSGHDHDLEHLELDGWPTSFVVAGGGGAEAGAIERDDRGPFARARHGFFHLHLDAREARGTLLSESGKELHEFSRSLDGTVRVLPVSSVRANANADDD